MTPDRIWLGRLAPDVRRQIRDALAPLGWNVREAPCYETASSLTPVGDLGILILEAPSKVEPIPSPTMPTLWVVPSGEILPRNREDPPQEYLFLPATAEEIVLRVGRLAASAFRSAEQRRLSRMAEIEVERRKGIVGAIAHDLTSPLTAAIEYLELLLDGTLGPVTPQQRSILSEAQGASRRVTERLGEILDATRTENGIPMEIDPEKVELKEILGPFQQQVPCLLMEKEQRLTVRLEPNLAPILGDRRRLGQALHHLVDNAARYSPHGTSIQIDVFRDPEMTGFVQIAVSDSGRGFSIDRFTSGLDRIADRGADPPVGKRLGIGLILTRAIVEAHGGELLRRYRPHGGSSVRIRLPIWGSRTASIAGTQARLSSNRSIPDDAWLCRASGRHEVASIGPSQRWAVLSPGELLLISPDPPKRVTRLGRVSEFRTTGALLAALVPRMRWRVIGSARGREVSCKDERS